jgi:uncharacterized protein with FMN-binding domain
MKKRGRVVLVFALTFSFGIPRQDNRIGRIDPSTLPDGSYVGEYRIVPPFGTFVGNRRVKVQVEVQGGRIQGIAILSPEGSTELLNAYGKQVIERQSLEVDAVGGATWTPRAFLKAVETALRAR